MNRSIWIILLIVFFFLFSCTCTQRGDIESKDAKAYFNRGNAYADKGQYDQAIPDYTKALEINPKDGKAYYNRAYAYYSK